MQSIISGILSALSVTLVWNYCWFQFIDPKLELSMKTAESIAPTPLLFPILMLFFLAFTMREQIGSKTLAAFSITVMLAFPATFLLAIYYILVGHLPFMAGP